YSRELLVVHHFRNWTTATHSFHHALLSTINLLGKLKDLSDALGWDKHSPASVSNHIVILLHYNVLDEQRASRINLHHSIASAEHGDATPVHWKANIATTVNVATEPIDDSPTNLFHLRSIGDDIARE